MAGDPPPLFARVVYKWLQMCDLSMSYSNPRVDFASGFLVAEICSKFMPSISMHSFSNFISLKMRQDNWKQLAAAWSAKGINVPSRLIDETMGRKPGAAIELIELLYTTFTGKRINKPKIGELSGTQSVQEVTISKIAAPETKKAAAPGSEAPPTSPQMAPRKRRFIGAPPAGAGDGAGAAPISFEPAQVSKGGPGFQQLRAGVTEASSVSPLVVVDGGLSQGGEALVDALIDPVTLAILLTQRPPKLVMAALSALPASPRLQFPSLVQAIGEWFIRDFEGEISPQELIDMIFALPCMDPLARQFLLGKVLRVTPPGAGSAVLWDYVSKETVFPRPVVQFLLRQVEANIAHDRSAVLPMVLLKLAEVDAVAVAPLVIKFPEDLKSVSMVRLYARYPQDAGARIRAIVSGSDRALAAKLLDLLAPKLEGEQALELLLQIPDPGPILLEEYEVEGEGERFGPVASQFSALALAMAIQARVQGGQEEIPRELAVLSIFMNELKPSDAVPWLDVFKGMHELLYLGLSDPAKCEKSAVVLLALFRLLQGEVFGTFATLFKALGFALQQTAPPDCKATAIQFLRSVAELNPTMGQTVLKLCLNFPTKMSPELDDLIAQLKKGAKK